MTTGLAYAIDSAIKEWFANIFNSKDAIIAAVTSPKLKLKWIGSQEKKDAYRQMVVNELRQDENEVILGRKAWLGAGDKRESFYEFDSDKEMSTADVESEFMEF